MQFLYRNKKRVNKLLNNNVLNNNYVKLDTWSDQTHSKIKVI